MPKRNDKFFLCAKTNEQRKTTPLVQVFSFFSSRSIKICFKLRFTQMCLKNNIIHYAVLTVPPKKLKRI